jgi:transposase
MKTIQLTPRQRKDLSDRRRHAPDRRIYQRLCAVLWSDEGLSREAIADLLGVSTRQVGQWLRIFGNKGLDQLCTRHYRGDPGLLGPAHLGRLKQEIAKGAFHHAEQVRTWVEQTWGVAYSISGLKDLLRRIGASYHKVSGFVAVHRCCVFPCQGCNMISHATQGTEVLPKLSATASEAGRPRGAAGGAGGHRRSSPRATRRGAEGFLDFLQAAVL